MLWHWDAFASSENCLLNQDLLLQQIELLLCDRCQGCRQEQGGFTLKFRELGWGQGASQVQGWRVGPLQARGAVLLAWGSAVLGGSGNSDGKESACSVGDPGLIPGSGRSPREGNGNPLQYSCLEKSHGPRSLVGFIGVAKSWTRLSNFSSS